MQIVATVCRKKNVHVYQEIFRLNVKIFTVTLKIDLLRTLSPVESRITSTAVHVGIIF